MYTTGNLRKHKWRSQVILLTALGDNPNRTDDPITPIHHIIPIPRYGHDDS
ncbi:MAG: hypothetical protein IKQ12_05630 [Prevotella sp.]|nr:hypothetical protein [Prevotella sp.]MBR4602640.1 hypothetical protein [Prevotella sp.]MBR6139032.1 hypothetical protein [Prevotella sp.]